jgi:hypothetical protein
MNDVDVLVIPFFYEWLAHVKRSLSQFRIVVQGLALTEDNEIANFPRLQRTTAKGQQAQYDANPWFLMFTCSGLNAIED